MSRWYCGNIKNSLIGQEVLIYGWVKKNRKLGSLVFLNVADRSGMVQVTITDSNNFFNLAKSLKRESVVEISGIVTKKENPNTTLPNGDVEIQLSHLKVLSESETTPLIVENNTDALEDIRMKYRFLDLRRPIMQQNLFFRSKVLNTLRQFLISHDFIDVETPILGKPTPEGARDYLVPSRVHHGKFYALPQSPQIYKQLLMVSGFDRYFQIAKCFRDEDLRSDRQPEFTQLDMELSFSSEQEIQTLIEQLLQYTFKQTLGIEIKIPFLRMDYSEVVNTYGSDKPDLRFDLKLIDLTDELQSTSLDFINNAKQRHEVVKGIIVDQILDKKIIHELEKYAKDMKAKGLAYITYDGQQLSGPISKHFDINKIKNILDTYSCKVGTILLVVDNLKVANNALGIVRNVLADKLGLKTKGEYAFLWVVNWPLFEYDEQEKTYLPAHHPFTQPQDQFHDSFDSDKANALAKAYDIVLNGYELGGGSIRITDHKMQTRMFNAIGLLPNEINEKFGYLINAFKYGVPPHGGIAIGVDRLISLMLNLDNIKDVIAFPKNSNAYDQMLEAPSLANTKELDELGIHWSKK